MADTATATSDDFASRSSMDDVADAMRDAAASAGEHAAKAGSAAMGAGPAALRSASRLTYTSAYVLSYGVVYAAVFVAKSLPQENALMNGLRDGGAAAVDALRSR